MEMVGKRVEGGSPGQDRAPGSSCQREPSLVPDLNKLSPCFPGNLVFFSRAWDSFVSPEISKAGISHLHRAVTSWDGLFDSPTSSSASPAQSGVHDLQLNNEV